MSGFSLKKRFISGDVEINPCPKPKFDENFSICDWNFCSVVTHNFAQVSLLKAYIVFTTLTLFVCQKHTSI